MRACNTSVLGLGARARRAAVAVWLCLACAAAAGASPQPGLPRAPASIDRSTPRRALRLFLFAERSGDHLRAAYALDLGDVPVRRQRELGPLMAGELKTVFDHGLPIRLDDVSDDREGDPTDGPGSDTIGEISLYPGHRVPVSLDRVESEGEPVWVISRDTLAELPALYDRYGPSLLERYVPSWFPSHRFAGVWLWQWIGLALAAALSILLSFVLAAVFLALARRVAARTRADWDDRAVGLARGPARLFFFVLTSWIALEPLGLSAPGRMGSHRLLVTVLIFSVAWFAQRMVGLAAKVVEERVPRLEREGGGESLRLRGLQTQVLVLRRVASIAIGFIAVSLALLQFEVVRTVGMSLLASAGIVGVVVGVAAQRSIAALLGGIQLSITQPIRMGDRVVLEGELGTVEEITLTYVVLKLWDERRLIAPVSRFLDTPFQNWTKATSPELLGTVVVHADYSLPVEEVRRAFDAMLEDMPEWDRRSKSLLVTDAKERTVELRALVSARNSDDLFALRCAVRERLVGFLRDLEGGRHLPRVRVHDGDAGAGESVL